MASEYMCAKCKNPVKNLRKSSQELPQIKTLDIRDDKKFTESNKVHQSLDNNSNNVAKNSESCNALEVSKKIQEGSSEYKGDIDASTTTVCNSEMERSNIIFSKKNNYEDIYFEHSKNIRLGNITNIYGDVYINTAVTLINQQSVTNQVLVQAPAPTKHGDLSIIYRRDWLALSPTQERTLVDGPAKFVIIIHTVSEAEHDQLSNIHRVQQIQRYHMTKNNFDDIGYNFVIGSDQNVYEGRGWSVVGRHTRKYNTLSVGIAFIGNFNDKLPSQAALNQVHVLIQRGIKLGAIAENYTLLGHCQCKETESPGQKLFQEIQRWDKWDSKISTLRPSPIIDSLVNLKLN